MDLTGQKLGRLTVVNRLPDAIVGRYRYRRWMTKCECGNENPVNESALKARSVVSCGCWRSERITSANTVHGKHGSPQYKAWVSMIQRCENPNATGYERYGAVGITVCPRWRESYQSFLDDMGPRPSPKHSLDRYPNNAGNYEPGNCRWATAKEQRSNRRTSI